MIVSATGWIRGAGLFVCGLATLGCDEELQLEPSVDARSGLSQPGTASGKLLDESVACERYRTVLNATKKSLECDELEFAKCPTLIRPAASQACVQYSEASVSECVEQVEDYRRCSDFQTKTCLVTAVTGTSTEGCEPPAPPSLGEAGVPEDAGFAMDAGDDAGGPADASATPPEVEAGMPDAGVGPLETDSGLSGLDAG